MKKILAVSFCTTLVLGFAASAFAIHIEAPAETSSVIAKGGLVTLDGSIRQRAFLKSTSTHKDGNDSAGYQGRLRVGATVKTGDAVTGRFHLETGENEPAYDYAWGDDTAALHNGGSKRDTLRVLEAWIQYVPSNWGLKVGHMPLALGNKLFFDHTPHGDDAIVAFMNPNDATHLAALTIKFTENDLDHHGDEIDGYVVLGTYKAGAMNFGADWTYLHSGATGAQPAPADPVVMGADVPGLSMSNIGLRGDMDAGNFKIKGDVEFQTGRFKKDATVAGGEIDAGGWAGMIEASTKVGGAWTLGGLLAYGSGDDGTDATEAEQFINFLGNTRYQSTMNGYILGSPAAGGAKNQGIQNQTLVQLYGMTTTQLMGKDLKLKARLNWMKMNEKHMPTSVQDDEIGTEIELFADWKLAQGLVYGIEAAYLFTGDAWAYDSATNTNLADMDENVFFLRHRLELAW